MTDYKKNLIISVRLNEDQYDKIKTACENMGISMSAWMRVAALRMAKKSND